MRIEEALKSTKTLPLASRTLLNIIQIAGVLESAVALMLKPYGLSEPQFNVLRILRGQKGQPANLQTIQERMVKRMSNTTRLVDKLVDKGLVYRRICPNNRRKVEISITDDGLELLRELDPIVTASNERLLSALSADEQRQLNHHINKLRL